MAECTVYIAKMCSACNGTGKVQRGKQAFYTCAMCQGSGRKIIPAPDLLEALKEIVEYQGGANSPLEDQYVMERVHAAIAKAEGRE